MAGVQPGIYKRCYEKAGKIFLAIINTRSSRAHIVITGKRLDSHIGNSIAKITSIYPENSLLFKKEICSNIKIELPRQAIA